MLTDSKSTRCSLRRAFSELSNHSGELVTEADWDFIARYAVRVTFARCESGTTKVLVKVGAAYSNVRGFDLEDSC